MRKSYFAIIALGALVIASCQKENSADLPKVDSPVFTATLDTGSDTKTELVERDGKKKSEWVSGDAIRVLNGTNIKGCDAVYTTTDEGASATFKTDVKDFTGTEFVAMYPASPAGSAWWNKESPEYVNKLYLNPVQAATVGTYDPNAHIAVAHSENTSLAFINAVSLLKFTVASDNVSEVCIYPNTSTDYVAGNFNIAVTGEHVGTITKERGKSDGWTNDSYVKATGTFEKGNTYYIACLPTTFTTGFTVEVVSNNIKGDNKTTKKNYELKRNTILDLGNVEYKKTLYLKPNDNWNKDGAWFAAYFFGDSNTWVEMEKVGDTGYYKVVAPDVTKYPKVVFCRMNPTSVDFSWDEGKKWNQTGDLTIGDENCYTITDGEWDKSGSWSVYGE